MGEATTTCAVEPCARKPFCRGWCRSHYARWYKHGDVQADKPLPGDLPVDVGWCTICRQRKPLAQFFPALDRPSGRSSYCRGCMATLRATKYRDALAAQHKRWIDRNPGKPAEYRARWVAKGDNRAKRSASRARWASDNPERNGAIARAADAARRARERGAPGAASVTQIQARWDYFGGRCWMCGGEAEATDHVKPLAKGGSHWPSNMRPACHPCNNAKRARWPFPTEIMRGREATDRQGPRRNTA